MTKWEYKVIQLTDRDGKWVASSGCSVLNPKTGEMEEFWEGEPYISPLTINSVEGWLNEMGNEGWELIKIRGDLNQAFYYFKRPL